VATASSLRRIARLAHKLESEMKAGGMSYPWKSLFKTNAILTRVVAHLAEHAASEAEGKARGSRVPLPKRVRATQEAGREA
jgi:hypothetical protein